MRRLLVGIFLFAATATCCFSNGAPVAPGSPPAPEVTFNRDVAPILFKNCATCHHPGEAAPFKLLTYEDAKRRSSQIADVTRRRFMPPWLPEKGHGDFAGARRLTDEQIQTLDRWAKAGAPRGEPRDLPPAPKFTDGWQLGPPDLVLDSPPYTLSADGGDQFRNFVIPIDLKEPKWVETIELRPTNPRATHHARLGVDRSLESVRRDAEDTAPGYEGMAWGQDPDGQLVTWVPGMVAHPGVPGAAWRIYPKTCLVLHVHMQPTGKTEVVQFHVGVHFAKEPPKLKPVMMRIGSRDIDIPAGTARYVANDVYVLPVDLDVYSIFPHAHSICREAAVRAELPDGTIKPLIWIKNFDEKWHDNYRYVTPVRLPRGTKLQSAFRYENTDENIHNRHHPPTRVVYGSNVVDEMADVYMQVTTVRPDERTAFMEDLERYDTRSQIIGFDKTLQMHPEDPWSREGLAACKLAIGRPDEAIITLEDRLKLGTDPNHALVSLAGACYAIGDYVRAANVDRQVLSKDAAYSDAWLGLGKALDAQKKVKEAEQAYDKAAKLAPALTDAYLSLGENLEKQGRLPEAAAACEQAIKFSPDMANLHVKLAEILARQRRYDDALHTLETAWQLAPYTHPPKVLLAVYYNQNGDRTKAKLLLTEAHTESPSHPVPLLFLAQFAAQEKKWDDVCKYLADATACPTPSNWPESHKKRFMVLLETERFKLAQQLQDESLAKSAVTEWIKYDPENQQLQQIYKSMRSAAQ